MNARPCRDDPDLWFDWGEDTDTHARIAAAKALCQQCPDLLACRAEVDVMEADLPQHRSRIFGIWAGETPLERIRRRELREEAIR